MGAAQTRVRTDETAFVIPAGIRLSANQRAQLLATGQELGVPFVITELGASRATNNHVRRSTIRNLVAVKRGSIKLVGCDAGGGLVSLSFVYDASVPARAHIYLKARDGCLAGAGGPAVSAVSVSDAKVTWGPIRLAEGCDMVFDSASLGLLVHESLMLADRPKNSKESFRIGKPYDVILHLAPDTAAAGASHPTRPSAGLGSLLGRGLFGGKRDAEAGSKAEGVGGGDGDEAGAGLGVGARGRGLVPVPGDEPDGEQPINKDAPCSPIKVSSISLTTQKLQVDLDQDDDEEEGGEEEEGGGGKGVGVWKVVRTEEDSDGPESRPDKMKVVEMAVTRPTKRSWLSARRRGAPEKEAPSPRSGPSASAPPAAPSSSSASSSASSASSSSSSLLPRNVARCEVTYAYLDNSLGKPASSPRRRPPNAPPAELALPSAEADETDAGADADAGTDVGKGADTEAGRATMALRPALQRLHVGGALFAMHDIYGVDSKAGADNEMADCVICLSTPRSVLVYPCRHMCMCADCAETMPPQGIKCPMCRHPAMMLISINAPTTQGAAT